MDFSVFDSLLDSVFVLDADRKIRYCNSAAATLCGSSPKRLSRDVYFYDVIRIFNEELFVNKNGFDGKDTATPYTELDYELKSGKRGKTQIAIQPFRDGDEPLWTVLLRDVTLEEVLHGKYRAELEQKQGYIVQLQQAQKELEQYSKNLEKMVEARTLELARANLTLSATMNSLGQGFVVFDRQGICSDFYTKACEEILEAKPAGLAIPSVLKLEGKDKDQFAQWIQATFAEMLPFDSMRELAPQSYSHSKGRTIKLDYYPIRDPEEKIISLVLVATDITAEKEAKEALEREKLYAGMIVKMIKSREQFALFLKSARETIDDMQKIASDFSRFDHAEAFRKLHTLEGEAGAFSVAELRSHARACQEVIEPLRHGEKTATDIKPLFQSKIHLLSQSYAQYLHENEELFKILGLSSHRRVEVLVEDATQLSKELRQFKAPLQLCERFDDMFLKTPLSQYIDHFETAARTVAAKINKKLMPFQVQGGELRFDGDAYAAFFASLVHVFRNAVDHGIEAPDVRREIGKPDAGQISIVCKKDSSGGIVFEISDDGRGIDPIAIRAKLHSRHPTVAWNQISDEDVIQHIFDEGFSSREEVGEFSGRGVGLDAVKVEVERLGGSIWAYSHRGQGTTLRIEIPKVPRQGQLRLGA